MLSSPPNTHTYTYYTSNGVVVAIWLVSSLAPKFQPEGYFLGPLLVPTCLSVGSSYCIGKCGSKDQEWKTGCKAGEEGEALYGPITTSATSKGVWLLAPGKYFESSRSCPRSICPRGKRMKHVFIKCWHHWSKICPLRHQPLPTPAPLGCNCLGPEWFQQTYDPIVSRHKPWCRGEKPEVWAGGEAHLGYTCWRQNKIRGGERSGRWSHGNLKWAIRGSNTLALLNLYVEIHSWYIFYKSTLQLF